MKKIISVAKTTVLLLWRNGTIPALAVMVSAFSAFIFFATNSNSNLTNELHLRLKYALISMSVLINLAVLYIGVFSLRKDIDERRFHTVSSAPVFRSQIWSGKFFGILTTAVIVFLISFSAITLSSYLFIKNWDKQFSAKELHENFITSYMECLPDMTELNEEVKKEYAKRLKKLIEKQKEEGKDQEAELEGDIWRQRKILLREIQKEKQIIEPASSSQWKFNWSSSDISEGSARIVFKSYSNNRKVKFKGKWSIENADGKVVWQKEFESYPYIEQTIKIPSEKMPDTDQFVLKFENTGKTYLIFPIFNNGLKIMYPNRSIFVNALHYMLFSFLGIAIADALALTCASIFSFPVAVFVAFITYLIGSFSGFFKNIIHDLSFHDTTFSTIFYKTVISFVLWLTQMLKIPPVSSLFADGISIPTLKLLSTWGISFFIYFIIIVFIGTQVLKNKELDKILTK
jgi:hypothetical protein